MHRLTFYTTPGCHLCEQAEELLRTLQESGLPLHWESVDIAVDDALYARYGWSIPVLQRSDGEELGWPFDSEAARAFVTAGQ